MRSRRTVAAALLLLFGLSAILAAAPQSFPLHLRGGGGIRANLVKSKKPQMVWLIVDFAPAPRRVLRPGEGAWLDRVLRAGEPARLDYETSLSEARELKSFLRVPGHEVTFECYNSGKGYLFVTKIRGKSVRID